MGIFKDLFKKKEKSENVNSNNYLEDQNTLFNDNDNTPNSDMEATQYQNNYADTLEWQPKTYDDVPVYKAARQKMDVVVDKNQIGYEPLNDDVNAIELETNNLHEDLKEIVNSEPIIDMGKDEHKNTSIFDSKLDTQIKENEEIDVISLDEPKNEEIIIKEDESKPVEVAKDKLSIFGTTDEPVETKVHEAKEESKISNAVKPQLDTGTKICPKCGAKIVSTAKGCFLCGHYFE